MGLAMENQGEQSILKMLAKWLSNALVASLFLTLMIIFVILVSGFLKSDWVGTWKPILDPQLIVSIWVAELPLAYFVKYILGERVDRPVLEILDLLDERTGQFGYDPTYYGITVWNKGATIAEDCDLSIDISGLQELSIAWQPTRNQPVDIRPDRKQKTEILRAVPLESILEVPNERDWNAPRKFPYANYRGRVCVGAKNCKPAKREFEAKFDKDHNRIDIRLM